MYRSIIYLTILLFLITACTQQEPPSKSSSPFIDAYKQAKEIKEISEDRKNLAEEVLNDEDQNKHYSVVKVVDGDTIDVSINGKTKRVRIIGLNTPEAVDPRRPVECFGKEASKKAKELLAGQKVQLETDLSQGEYDKHGRLLRYVYLKDGTDIALEIIKGGYGYEYTYELPYENQKKYDKAEAYARKNELGLWAPGVCVEEE